MSPEISVASKNKTYFWLLALCPSIDGTPHSHLGTQAASGPVCVIHGLFSHCHWAKEKLEVPAAFALPRPEVTCVIFAHVSWARTSQGAWLAPRQDCPWKAVRAHLVGSAVSTTLCRVVGPSPSAPGGIHVCGVKTVLSKFGISFPVDR